MFSPLSLTLLKVREAKIFVPFSIFVYFPDCIVPARLECCCWVYGNDLCMFMFGWARCACANMLETC